MATTYKATPRKFSMQAPFEVILSDTVTDKLRARLNDLKTSGLENTVEMVYPTGGSGNAYIGGGFAHSRRATFNIESATFNTEVMAIQNGTEIAVGQHEFHSYDLIDVTAENLSKLGPLYAPVDDKLNYCYLIGDDGMPEKIYEQGTTATASTATTNGTFVYTAGADGAAGTIAFADGDGPAAGDQIAFFYTRLSTDTAQKLELNVSDVPDVVNVTAKGFAKDICSGQLFPCVLEGRAQVDGNWSFDLSADGDPVVHSVNMEFVKTCTSDILYKFIVYTDEEEA